MNAKIEFLKKKADQIRSDVIKVAVGNEAGHIGPSLSSVDILVALYYGSMAYRPKEPLWANRDRMIFSKAHGCYALYAILADLNVIPKAEWEGFYTQDSTLLGCMEKRPEYGLEAGCGSLGHGLPMAVGLAHGAKLQKKSYRVYCIIGDGEMQEGTTWESLQFAVKHELTNLTLIVDFNQLQAIDFTVNILDRDKYSLLKRLEGFELSPHQCDGHDVIKLTEYFHDESILKSKTPKVLIANTIKGFGLKCMENVSKFHFRIPSEEEMEMGRSYGY